MTDLPPSACWTLPDHVDRAAALWPDVEAVVFDGDDERLTFAGFAARTVELARALRALGVGAGDRVGVLMHNGPEALVAVYGASRLGAIPVPINGRFKARELAYVVADAGLRVVLTADRGRDVVDFPALLAEALPGLAAGGDELAAPDLRDVVVLGESPVPGFRDGASFAAGADRVDADELVALQRRIRVRDLAMIMYTSGTTAAPKGCRMSHEALVRTGIELGRRRFPMVAGDRMWNPLPLFHFATLLPFNGCLAVGATFVGMHRFEPAAAIAQLQRERCTVGFVAFDLIWQAVLDHPDAVDADLTALRLVNVNGVPERTRAMAARTPWLTQISPYGATEGGGLIALSHVEDDLEQRIGSAGRPFAGVEVRIVDPDEGTPVPAGVRGEISYRGYSSFDGYHGDPDPSATDDEGWFHSGDLGSVDGEGRLTYVGRIKDVMKVGGENVAAADVEGFLAEHPAIAEVQVVAAPDARYREVPCAFVQLRPGASLAPEELIEHCVGRIASYKIPRYVRIVDEWPMSGTKIQKFRLRERIAAELEAAGVREAPRITSHGVEGAAADRPALRQRS